MTDLSAEVGDHRVQMVIDDCSLRERTELGTTELVDEMAEMSVALLLVVLRFLLLGQTQLHLTQNALVVEVDQKIVSG